MKRLSFQHRLLLGIVFLIVGGVGALGYVGNRVWHDFLMTRFLDRMNFMANYLAQNVELGILLEDERMLQHLAHNLFSEKDVIGVLITRANGKPVISMGETGNGAANSVSSFVYLQEKDEDQALWSQRKKQSVLGEVKLFYSTDDIQEAQARIRSVYVATSLALGAFGAIIFFLLSRSLATPIKDLVTATARVASGELDLSVDGGALPETRQLASAFNTMVNSLAESRQKLFATHQEIIRHRTLVEVAHFSLTVAHEIKNPLGIMKGAVDILKKPEIDEEVKATMLGYIEEEVVRLNRLIQSFLGFSRFQSFKLIETDANALLRDLLKRADLEWSEKVEIGSEIPEEPCLANIDPDLLTQVLLNVLMNGCQSCAEEGHVFVRVAVDNGHWCCEVADDGCGLSQEAREKAFEPFFTTKSQGTGLGLAFAASVIKAHGGEISLRDNLPKGTVCRIELSCR
jgi:signal transduction histidine kinase